MALTGLPPLGMLNQAMQPQLPAPEDEVEAANAAVQALLEQAAQRATQAQGQSASALQTLQGAEAEQAPQVSPLTAGLSGGLARIATTLGGGPDYAAQTQETIAGRNKLMRDERAANIKRLRETYEQAAKAAQEAGDHEAEIKSRTALAKLDTAERRQLAADKAQTDKESADVEWGRKKELAKIDQRHALEQIAAKAKTEKGEKLSPSELLRGINTMTVAIRNDPELKDYAVIRDQLTTGRDAYADNNSAGDIILMRAVARATDPRTGVREEEYRTFKDAQGALATRWKGMTTAMIGKGQLTEFGRKSLLNRLQSLEKRKKFQANRSLTRFRGQIETYLPGADPDLVMQAIEPEEESGKQVTEGLGDETPTGEPVLGTKRADGKVLVERRGQLGWVTTPAPGDKVK